MMLTRVKKYHVIILILLLASVLRFVYLDRIPTALSGDELLYAVTAKSVWLTGHDLTGTWNPLSAFFFRSPPNEAAAELPYFIQLPLSGPFPFSLFTAKLPFALMSIGIVLLIYGIAGELFGTSVGIAAGLVASINPWLTVTGRTGYEITPATFFYLLTLFMLLKVKNWKILWAFVPVVLAFYSYIGTKLISIPFIVLAVFLAYLHHKKKYLKSYIVLCLISIFFVLGFVYSIKTSPIQSRLTELIFPNSPLVVSQVNENRRAAISTPILTYIINRYAVYTQIVSAKLFRVFSASYLFVEGDQIFLPEKQSFFYYIDSIFLCIGLFYLFIKKRSYLFFIGSFIFIGTIPHLFHKTIGDFSFHSTLIFPFIVMLVGAGIVGVTDRLNNRLKTFVIAIIAAAYVMNILSFAVIYFFQYPLADHGDFSMRVLSKYLYIANKSRVPVYVYSNSGKDLLKKYLFYTNSMTASTMPEIQNIFKNNAEFEFNEIKFTSCDKTVTASGTALLVYDAKCGMEITSPHIQIARLTDAGGVYKIYNDTVCAPFKLNPFLIGARLSDFNVEELSTERFCKIYFN